MSNREKHLLQIRIEFICFVGGFKCFGVWLKQGYINFLRRTITFRNLICLINASVCGRSKISYKFSDKIRRNKNVI